MFHLRKKQQIPGDSRHFIRTEIDDTDFKNENLVTKKQSKKTDKTPYSNSGNNNNNNNNNNIDSTLKILDFIAVLKPGKRAQIAAKKNSRKVQENQTK